VEPAFKSWEAKLPKKKKKKGGGGNKKTKKIIGKILIFFLGNLGLGSFAPAHTPSFILCIFDHWS
jgi:hypothetical protein